MRSALPVFAAALVFLPSVVGAQSHASTSDPDLPSLLADVPSSPGWKQHLDRQWQRVGGSLTFTSAHDSHIGWYDVLTPSLDLRLAPRLALDVTTPLYLGRFSSSTDQGMGSPSPASAPRVWAPGDTFLTGNFLLPFRTINTSFQPSLVLPTGDAVHGLSNGRVTFNLDQHFGLTWRRIQPQLDLGFGNASSVLHPLITDTDTSTGWLAHFQAGLITPFPLPHLHAAFTSLAYEQLPVSHPQPGSEPYMFNDPSTAIASHTSIEDNGFINSLVLPLGTHFAVGGFYDRSLRLHTDTAAFSFQIRLRHKASQASPADASLLR